MTITLGESASNGHPSRARARESEKRPGRGAGLAGRVQCFLLPAPCLACGRPLGPGRVHLGLCLPCRGALARPPEGCAVCGEPIPAAGAAPLPAGFACGRCRRNPPAFETLRAAWEYRGPVVDVVRALKFRGLDYLGRHLGAELVPVVRELTGTLTGDWDLVVPVPLHWRRRWRRGYNQAERIARSLAGHLGLPCRSALRRRRATRSQVGLPRSERLVNPRGAFAPRRRPGLGLAPSGGGLVGRRILLVDDVVTSGATMGAAAEALLAAGAGRVAAIAVARTPFFL